ncbi:MAG: hypothetical protein RLP44_24165 [Aggregatilineales bacterium]
MSNKRKNQQLIWHWTEYLLSAAPLLLAFAVYGYTLRLPFFLDDGAHFDILAQTSGLEFWGDFPTFPFYRPLVFTIWQGYERLSGGYDPVAFHYLNVICFGIAGILCGQVTKRLTPPSIRFPASVVAGILFVLFPFSYQAVGMVAALFHLTLAVGVMLSVWAGLKWLDNPKRMFVLVIAWSGAFIAVFSHENGVLILPLMVGAIVIGFSKEEISLRRIGILLAPICMMVSIYLLQWWRVRPQDATQINNALDVSLAVLLQGLVYPFAALIRPFITGDIDPIALVIIAMLIVFVSVVAFARFALKTLPALLYGVGWYVIAILPAALFLTAGYVLGQTRLALFASLGGSIFWGIIIASLWCQRSSIIKLMALVVLIGFIGVSLEFLAMRRGEFLQLAAYQRNLLAQFDTLNVEATNTVVINTPDFLIPDEANRRFLIGTEGVLFVDPASDYGLQWTINSVGNYRDISVIAFPEIQRNSGFGFSTHPPALGQTDVTQRVRNADYVFVTEFHERDFEAVLVGGQGVDAPLNAIGARFAENQVELISVDAHYNDDYIEIRSQWRVLDPDAIKMFVHVTCDGLLIAQSDGFPWGDTFPFADWQAGDENTDIRRAYFEETFSPDCLEVYVGLYYQADVTRLEAVDSETNSRFENDLIPVNIIFEG